MNKTRTDGRPLGPGGRQARSTRHLNDLRRAHAAPPPDVKVNTRGIPKLVPPILEQSFITSPAA